jgi:hypothetical protein
MARRKPKRLKTGDEPNEEVVVLKVRVKVKSDNNKEEEESSDNDANEDGEEEERLVYVVPRLDYILMDYNESMFETLIPNCKVIRPINRWCYTNLDPVDWGENSIDRCPTYGVCCSSGPTGRRCVKCGIENVIYVCILIVLKDNKGEEITRMIDAQWISHIFEATHLECTSGQSAIETNRRPMGLHDNGVDKEQTE